MIRNICDYVGKYAESYLFIGSRYMKECVTGNIHIVGTKEVLEKPAKPESVKNEFLLQNMEIEFKRVLKVLRPDIVNFQGIGELAIRCIHICREFKVPCVYTEHLFIGTSKSLEKYEKSVAWEKELFAIPNLKIIAVSTGMKKKIMSCFPFIKEDDISVIANGTDFKAEYVQSNLEDEYNLTGKKILLCVGTLNERKNQLQIVSAFKLLPEEMQDKIKIIFIGRDKLDGKLQQKIACEGLSNQIIYAGTFSSSDMKKFYSIADGLIMPSLAEGLSIAALEMISYGKPVIMYEDSECADDLNDDKVTCFASKSHSDKNLTDAIINWYHNSWDIQYIRDYSEYFNLDRVAKEYIELYEVISS